MTDGSHIREVPGTARVANGKGAQERVLPAVRVADDALMGLLRDEAEDLVACEAEADGNEADALSQIQDLQAVFDRQCLPFHQAANQAKRESANAHNRRIAVRQRMHAIEIKELRGEGA